MTNNFELLRPLVAEKLPADREHYNGYFLYIQLLARQSDDPMINGVKDPAYHGNMHSRALHDYFVYSLEQYDRLCPEWKDMCDNYNVRAYIRLNRRSDAGMAKEMERKLFEQRMKNTKYDENGNLSTVANAMWQKPQKLLASAAGVCNVEPKETLTWIVDLDKEYLPYEKDIRTMVAQCNSAYSNENMFTVPTKSAKHLLAHPFNQQMFYDLWRKHPELSKMKMLDIHKDNPTILYVNVKEKENV